MLVFIPNGGGRRVCDQLTRAGGDLLPTFMIATKRVACSVTCSASINHGAFSTAVLRGGDWADCLRHQTASVVVALAPRG
eukprot:COSAG06_NODE_103_length_23904_cov_10.413401_19_plen_80_part_00